jgi:signal transduction histidine kinase
MKVPAQPAGLREPESEPAPAAERSRPVAEPGRVPTPAHEETEHQPYWLADIRRSERSMILVRWAGALFAVIQVLAYRELPYPPGVRETALGLAAFLALANAGIWYASRRTDTLRSARSLAVTALTLDIAVASAFVWLYAFDPSSALWAILFIIPLEGAIRFGLPGALVSWAAITLLYLGRELWRVEAFPASVTGPGGYPFEPESISFRMGIALLIALVAGMMARNLTRQRAQLTDAMAELRRTDVLRSRLVATLAHDVRNPLTTIRGTLKTVARHGDRLDRRTLDELISTADKQAGRLERLASDLLDLARIERGRLNLDVQDVRLREAVERGLDFVDDDRRFEVTVDEGLAVRADSERLEQIIVNLATNALSYGEPPFLVRSDPAPEDAVDLVVCDQGVGVLPEEAEFLFEPFRTEAEKGSVGLGLAIVKALAEAQGGSVSYEPNKPRGACFRVRLREASG